MVAVGSPMTERNKTSMARGRRKAQAENGSDPRARKQILSGFHLELVFLSIFTNLSEVADGSVL